MPKAGGYINAGCASTGLRTEKQPRGGFFGHEHTPGRPERGAPSLCGGRQRPDIRGMTDTPSRPADPERNRLSGRLARTAKVGANLSGAGLAFAAQSLFGGDEGDQRTAKALAAALGKSKGPLMKIAQLVSTIPDFLPPEYANELSQLQAEAPAMGWPFVKRRMRAERRHDAVLEDAFGHRAEQVARMHRGADLG